MGARTTSGLASKGTHLHAAPQGSAIPLVAVGAPMTTPTPTCLAANRCRGYDHTTNQPAPPDRHTPLCRPCLDHTTRDIPLLVHDWRDLEQLLPKSLSVWSDGQPGHSGEAPIPLHLDVEALQAQIWWLSTAWAEVIADRHHLADPPHRRPSPLRRYFVAGPDVTLTGNVTIAYRESRLEHPTAQARPMRPGPADIVHAIRILTPRTENLARIGPVQMVSYPHADPDIAVRYRSVQLSYVSGAQGLLDLTAAHQRARSMLGLTEPTYVLPGKCQARGCGRPALRVKDGSDTVWCDRCGVSMTRDDYDRLGNLFLRPMEAA
jgi:hypothetical protein